MKDFWYYLVGFTFIFAVLCWGFMILSTQAHEDVHVAIFENYNISTNVSIKWWTGEGVTYPDSAEYRLYCNEQCKYSNSLNEIVGYNTDKIAFAFLISAYLICILLVLITYKEEKPCADSSDLTGETQNQNKY